MKDYKKENSIKVIIENKEGKILLVQESADDEWMPNHWGLPGGRPKLKEPLHDALVRTVKEETDIDVEPLGLYKIEEVLHEDRTVMMFITVAHFDFEIEIKGRVQSHKWVDAEDVAKMDTSEFTAFYAKDLILDYLAGNREYVDFKLIETQQYYGLDESEAYKKWINSGTRQ